MVREKTVGKLNSSNPGAAFAEVKVVKERGGEVQALHEGHGVLCGDGAGCVNKQHEIHGVRATSELATVVVPAALGRRVGGPDALVLRSATHAAAARHAAVLR